MPAKKSPKPQNKVLTVAISRNWQLAFVAAMTISFLANIGLVLYLYTSHGSYISAGTWWFQISQWAYPFAYAVVGLIFAWRRYGTLLHRLFWAVLLAVMGTALYGSVSTIATTIRMNTMNPYYGSNDPGLWYAFGWDWTMMICGFVLYCLALFLIDRRHRR